MINAANARLAVLALTRCPPPTSPTRSRSRARAPAEHPFTVPEDAAQAVHGTFSARACAVSEEAAKNVRNGLPRTERIQSAVSTRARGSRTASHSSSVTCLPTTASEGPSRAWARACPCLRPKAIASNYVHARVPCSPVNFDAGCACTRTRTASRTRLNVHGERAGGPTVQPPSLVRHLILSTCTKCYILIVHTRPDPRTIL